jgi:penicillin-binding protein 1A
VTTYGIDPQSSPAAGSTSPAPPPPPGEEPPAGPGGGRRRRRLIAAGVIALSFLLAIIAGSSLGYVLTTDIPEVRHLQDWRPAVLTTLYSADGEILHQFGAEKRIVVPLDQVPDTFLNALIATEDANFHTHVGIDPAGIARAIITDIIHLKKAQGGSTITQQLARSLYLKPEKTIRRKLQEMILALQIEKTFTKDEILTFYCNQVYMGHGRYGVEAASHYYFGKPAIEMTLAESALVAGLVQRPEAYTPFRAPERAMERRRHVLRRMASEGMISAEQQEETAEEAVVVARQAEEDDVALYFIEEVRRYLEAKYGEEALYQGGLEVYTTLDPIAQRAAHDAMFEGLRALDKRQGFRPLEENVLADAGRQDEEPAESAGKGGEDAAGGDEVAAGGEVVEDDAQEPADPLESFTHPSWRRRPVVGKLRHGLITEVGRSAARIKLGEYTAEIGPAAIDWTRQNSLSKVFAIGDVAPFLIQSIDEGDKTMQVKLDQIPLVEGALISIHPGTGEIRALIGGFDFNRSQFNRAVQSYRQAGSAFKPFVYVAALDAGYSLGSLIFDEPTVFVDQATGNQFQPNNFTRRYYGRTTLRRAMERSRNIVSVKLLNQVGYGRTIDLARRLGISSPLQPYPSLALGTMEVSLIDLTTAFSVFPNQGVRVEPHFIRYVSDWEGTILEEARPKITEALPADVAYLTTYVLEGVTESGTGSAARSLKRTVAGKTGTTDDLADAWFVGFSPSLVAGVWVGFDQKHSLGPRETGARAALPIWIDFMKGAHAGVPAESFTRPAGIVYVPLDRETGLRATVDSACPTPILEAFIEGTEPTTPCSEQEHFRHRLPYFLQNYEITRALELRIEPEALVRLIQKGVGDIELLPDGRELLLQGREDEPARRVRLDLSRSERRRLNELLMEAEFAALDEFMLDDPLAQDGDLEPVGIDGRPATIVPIRDD